MSLYKKAINESSEITTLIKVLNNTHNFPQELYDQVVKLNSTLKKNINLMDINTSKKSLYLTLINDPQCNTLPIGQIGQIGQIGPIGQSDVNIELSKQKTPIRKRLRSDRIYSEEDLSSDGITFNFINKNKIKKTSHTDKTPVKKRIISQQVYIKLLESNILLPNKKYTHLDIKVNNHDSTIKKNGNIIGDIPSRFFENTPISVTSSTPSSVTESVASSTPTSLTKSVTSSTLTSVTESVASSYFPKCYNTQCIDDSQCIFCKNKKNIQNTTNNIEKTDYRYKTRYNVHVPLSSIIK